MFQRFRIPKISFSPFKALQYFLNYKPYYLNHFLLLYLNRVLKPMPELRMHENESFQDLNMIWHPDEGDSRVILRWLMTEWCNYNCMNCPQEHSRDRIRGTYRVHCFDNHTTVEWIKAIDRAFNMREVALAISGGEPMLDMKNMHSFLKKLLPKKYINNVCITTNMSWNPSSLEDLPNREKLNFYITFHPSQTRFDDFIKRSEKLRDLGFSILFVSYVMTHEQALCFEELMAKFKEFNLPLHPNILWYSKPDDDIKRILQRVLEKADLYCLSGGITRGRTCLYPSISYEMNQNGEISMGCFPWIFGNIFKGEIPKLSEGPVKCPHFQCNCIGKYSFMKGFHRNIDLNYMKIYGNVVRKRLGLQKI